MAATPRIVPTDPSIARSGQGHPALSGISFAKPPNPREAYIFRETWRVVRGAGRLLATTPLG